MKGRQRLLVAGLGLVLLVLALTVIAIAGRDSLALNGIIYVDADAGGESNGTSWTDAYIDLQPALAEAEAGDEIWVAEGTYKPTSGTDRYASFQMVNGVAIYGGFGGTEDLLDERDWEAHPTILSGDLNGDDGLDFANNGDNSYSVFCHYFATVDSTAILDGFTITGGNAHDAYRGPYLVLGGGMYNYQSSPTLANCTFTGNSAGTGGGMYNYQSSPTLTNCAFEGNSADAGGGIANMDSSSPVLTNCTFSGNVASTAGGGIHNYSYSSPTLTNCSFNGNSAEEFGGGMYNWFESSPALTNCTFWGNSAGSYGGGMYNWTSSPAMINCTFWGNSAGWNGGGMYSEYNSPKLTSCILWDDSPEEIANSQSTPVITYSDVQDGYEGEGNIDSYPFFVDAANGDLHLRACSRCIDAGDPNPEGLPPFDFEGDDRIVDGDDDGTPTVDMGVDEVVDGLPCWHVYLPVVLRND